MLGQNLDIFIIDILIPFCLWHCTNDFSYIINNLVLNMLSLLVPDGVRIVGGTKDVPGITFNSVERVDVGSYDVASCIIDMQVLCGSWEAAGAQEASGAQHNAYIWQLAN